MIKVDLDSPIDCHGEPTDSLTIRKPKGGDIMDLGNPYRADAESGMALPDMALMGKWISKLGNVPVSSIRQMEIGDFMKCLEAIQSFFESPVRQDSSTKDAAGPDVTTTTA